MTYKKICEEYAFYTGKTSDIVRQLAFAGIAVIWIFKQDVAGRPQIAQPFRWALFMLILTLVFDFLHYAVGSMLWRIKETSVAKEAKEEARAHQTPIDEVNLKVSRKIHWPTEGLYSLKIVAILSAYVFLLIDVWAVVAW